MRAAKADTPGLSWGSHDSCGSYGVLMSRATGRTFVGAAGTTGSLAGVGGGTGATGVVPARAVEARPIAIRGTASAAPLNVTRRALTAICCFSSCVTSTLITPVVNSYPECRIPPQPIGRTTYL